jgi:protein SCO1/2
MMNLYSAVGYLKKLFRCIFFIGAILKFGGSPVWAAPPGSPWGAGYFPNVPLVTQDGNTVRFYDDLIKDKVVAINFIYTHCGDTCPLETASLRQVQKQLGDRLGKDVFFYSISIDPEHDTPNTLKEYAAKFQIGPGWTFLTGTKADTTLLRKKLGLYREESEEKKLSGHNVSFMIGNEATGQWLKRSPFDEPKVLAWLLGRKLHEFKVTSPGKMESYAGAKQLPNISHGEDLFRSRCDSCHGLGAEDGVGPGLKGVTMRRDRAWLTRWLKMPDRMLAEKDPVAIELFNRYKQLPMPNLRLSDTDVEALIDYMAADVRIIN